MNWNGHFSYTFLRATGHIAAQVMTLLALSPLNPTCVTFPLTSALYFHIFIPLLPRHQISFNISVVTFFPKVLTSPLGFRSRRIYPFRCLPTPTLRTPNEKKYANPFRAPLLHLCSWGSLGTFDVLPVGCLAERVASFVSFVCA